MGGIGRKSPVRVWNPDRARDFVGNLKRSHKKKALPKQRSRFSPTAYSLIVIRLHG